MQTSTRTLAFRFAILVLAGTIMSCAAQGPEKNLAGQSKPMEFPTIDNLPVITELPDPFLMQNGKRVANVSDWTRRRDELKQLILHYEYGQLPPPVKVTAREISSATSQPLEATQKELLLSGGPEGGKKVEWRVRMTQPLQIKGKCPVIICGDLCWNKTPAAAIKEAVKRGYIVIEFDRTEVAPDKNEKVAGIYAAWPGLECGEVAGWAWGFHRTADWALTLDYADASRLIYTGHSRGGKATLLAGALDERAALTVPNGSGAGGASVFRVTRNDAESLARITTKFPCWFQARFAAFGDKVTRLPFDQHSVRALVAPRALLNTEGDGDLWANPTGSQQAYLAAREVYKFLGASDKIGIYFRPGKHEHNLEDWTALLDFADKTLSGKTVERRFDKLPFPDAPVSFTWKAPK